MPRAGGNDSGSTLEAPSGARGPRARHSSSPLGREWSARPLAQEGRFREGAVARPCGAGASCPRPSGPSLWLRRPAVQNPGRWRTLGCTQREGEGNEAGEGLGSSGPAPAPGWGGSPSADSWARSGPRVARKPPHATQRLAPAACRRSGCSGSSSSSNSSEQRGRDIGEA